MEELLRKETTLLQTIDRLKIQANKENKERRVQKQLKSMANPKEWDNEKGEHVQVETPYTTRARELMTLYLAVSNPSRNIDERLDTLLHVKWTVKEFDCRLTREISELIDREADLLNRGRTSKSLESLRLRISHLFLEFVQTPEFNPEAVRVQKVHPL